VCCNFKKKGALLETRRFRAGINVEGRFTNDSTTWPASSSKDHKAIDGVKLLG